MNNSLKILILTSIIFSQGAFSLQLPSLETVDLSKMKLTNEKVQWPTHNLDQIKKDQILIENLTKLDQDIDGGFFKSSDNGGFSSGGGGNSVICYGPNGEISEISLLDYVEGVRKDQSLNKGVSLEGKTVREKLLSAFKRMEKRWPFLSEKLEQKALQVEKEMSLNLMGAQDGKLTPIIDMDLTFVPNKNALGHQCKIVRFAVQEKEQLKGQRKFNFVKELYMHPRTSDTTRAGIIIHEVLYEEAIKDGAKNSNFVRWLTYLISSPTFDVFEKEDFRVLELDEGSDFLRRRSIEFYKNLDNTDNFDEEYMSFQKDENVYILNSQLKSGIRKDGCLRYGICQVEKGVVLGKSDSSTAFNLSYSIATNGDKEKHDLPISDIAKADFRGCYENEICIGDMVTVQKFTTSGALRYDGMVIAIFGEGDFAIKVKKKTLKTPRSLKAQEKLLESEDLILYSHNQNVRKKEL